MNLGPLDGPVCLSCGASPDHHQPDCTATAECTCTELERMTVCHDSRMEPHLVGCPRWGTPKPNRDAHAEAVQAFANLAQAQAGEALAEDDPAVRSGMLRVIEMLDAVVEIEHDRAPRLPPSGAPSV